jgi:hypothetical protein
VKLGTVVTGYGEVKAIPLLLRRVAATLGVHSVEVQMPFRLPEGKLYKDKELERAVRFVSALVEPGGGVLILLDADADGHDCPATEAPILLEKARRAAPRARVEVVMAKREYESWFLAAASSIAGKRTLPVTLEGPPDPEEIRNAKGWLAERMANGYSETVDQPALSAVFDIELAKARSRSFDKFVRSVAALISAPK